MNEPRIFICYYPEDAPNAATKLMQQLAQDLQTAGATFIIEPPNQTDNEFVQFLARELPTCQWIIFAQTSTTLQASRTSLLYNAARKLVEQGTLQGMVRVIPGPEELSVPVPPALSTLNTYNLYQDYPKTLEKLLFIFSIHDTDKFSTQLPTQKSISVHRKISNPRATGSQPRTSASQFDHPTLAPPRQSKFRSMQARVSRKALLIGAISLLVAIAIIAAGVIYLTPKPPTPALNPVVGYAYFTSSALIKGTGTDGINDGIKITLNNLTPPADGNSYYAWLLPDNGQQEGNILRLGQMPPLENGQSPPLLYVSPNGNNLLARGSRILITEENSAVLPDTPNMDKHFWRYYAEIPQDNTAMGDNSNMANMSSLSHLDHLRHLLYTDPVLTKLQVKGGSAYWLLNNTHEINLLAYHAWTTRNVKALQADAVAMLDYIDGSSYVRVDVTDPTVLKSNTHDINQEAVTVGLIAVNAEQPDPAGYIKYMQTHLRGYQQASHTTVNETKQVLRISQSLNAEESIVLNMRKNVVKLLAATEAVSVTPKNSNPAMNDGHTNAILNNLYSESVQMYNGTLDTASGNRVGGSLWIFDHIQNLASFTIERYKGQ